MFQTVMWYFIRPKFIPLMWCPITLELEIVSNSADAVVEPIGGGTFDNNNASASWSMQERLIGDIVTLDNGLQNSYAQHVLSGKSLPINYSTYISILQAITPPTINVSVTRSVSRLKSVFFNFDNTHTTVTEVTSANTLSSIMNDFISFLHPQ